MKIAYEFWRNRIVHERCVVEIDVPDELASDPYLPDTVAGATLRNRSPSLPWEEQSASIEKSGYRVWE
jgi:hypothetical protein